MFGLNAYAQTVSNEGTDFWTVFPTHDPSGNNLATMNVNVTSRNNSRVTVSCGAYSETRDIKANTIEIFEIDRQQSYIDYAEGNILLTNRAIHIVVEPGMPKVVAYSHVYASNRSAATLILPRESLGQKYFSMNYTQSGGGTSGQNYLVLIAVEDDTDLILHKNDGTTIPINLAKAGDVYEFISTSKEDLTGTFVEIDQSKSLCKRFAAFSGATTITIGPCGMSSDPLLQQLYSVNSWGKNYGIVPFKNRSYIFRVLAQEDNTNIKMNGSTIATKNKGEYYESTILVDPAIVSADKLISVAQYSLTEGCSSTAGTQLQGDPEMVLLNPIEFNIKNITVFASNRNLILEKYINVFMKSNKTSTFRLNGTTSGISWTTMPSDPTYSFAQISVTEETLTLTADDGFNAIAYGFGRTESYAYSAGTNLYSTSTISLLNLSSGLRSSSAACLGQPTNPTLTVPYRLKSIKWNFSDGTSFIDNTLAPPVESLDNVGTKLFTYTSPVKKVFSINGSQIITALATLFPDDVPPCFEGSGDLEFNFEVEVVPLGNAHFDVPEICAGAQTVFKDNSNITGNSITEWKWSFDGTIKTDKDPIHVFTRGVHTVKLSVANAAGCWSDEYVQTFTVVKDFPKLEFNALEPVCFKDPPFQFVVNEKMGLIAATKTFKGKGVTQSGIFTPSVAGVGIHKITYVFASVAGCIDSVSQDIEVYATTVIDVPKTVYILAGGEKKIPAGINTPNATYNYKYKWTPSIGLSDDSIINPIASPEKDTEYTLTVSIDGYCDVSQQVLVKVLDQLSPPNSFSPNGDGINDVWNIASLDSYPAAEITVFNRAGQKVYYSKGYLNPFDGTFQNKLLPVGVYYYRISPNNGRRTISGSLTIIR
ncbi:gliding motility-associated C-terminal domain-containing protein [Pedobacter sp. Du54]|uniref:T9SS type B sorting domain-containing protein n=1 Tax=Pedobacter anseongensis TaxID=3133439 RepID=UPI003096B3DA